MTNIKYKFILLFVIFIQTISYSFAKGDDDPLVFRVTSYILNGENLDKMALDKNVKLVFFEEDGAIIFANYWINDDSYSLGQVYDFKEKTATKETDKEYASTTFTFIWNYYNSYDDEKGSASVVFQKVFTEDITKFTCIISGLNDNNKLILKGYQEK